MRPLHSLERLLARAILIVWRSFASPCNENPGAVDKNALEEVVLNGRKSPVSFTGIVSGPCRARLLVRVLFLNRRIYTLNPSIAPYQIGLYALG